MITEDMKKLAEIKERMAYGVILIEDKKMAIRYG